MYPIRVVAEEVGFEPTEPCDPLVFKTSAIDHSTILPLFTCALALHHDKLEILDAAEVEVAEVGHDAVRKLSAVVEQPIYGDLHTDVLIENVIP